jgi:RNA polymerase sigma factor (TIGR02999 family)
MASARGALTIQPTALVHEAWLKLESGGDKQWKNKAHFMGTAVRAMRCLLIDHARSRTTQKRGGGRAAMPLEEELLITDENAETFVQLDDSLEALASLDRELASVVELRFFAGLSDEEIAASLDISVEQAKKAWTMARAWLKQRLNMNENPARKSA